MRNSLNGHFFLPSQSALADDSSENANARTFWYIAEGFAIRRKQALADIARADAERQEQLVIAQVWNSYQGLATAGQRVEASNELLSSAELSYESMLISYRAGVAQIVELLQAQSTLADARSENASARTLWYIALVQLAHDTGVVPLNGESQPIELSVGQRPG